MNFVLFLAGIGGLVFLFLLVAIVFYMIVYEGVLWYNLTFYLLWLGMFVSLACTSVNLATADSNTKKAVIITQGVINGILVVLLGFTSFYYIERNINDRSYYIMIALPISLLLSVVAVSATVMNRRVS